MIFINMHWCRSICQPLQKAQYPRFEIACWALREGNCRPSSFALATCCKVCLIWQKKQAANGGKRTQVTGNKANNTDSKGWCPWFLSLLELGFGEAMRCVECLLTYPCRVRNARNLGPLARQPLCQFPILQPKRAEAGRRKRVVFAASAKLKHALLLGCNEHFADKGTDLGGEAQKKLPRKVPKSPIPPSEAEALGIAARKIQVSVLQMSVLGSSAPFPRRFVGGFSMCMSKRGHVLQRDVKTKKTVELAWRHGAPIPTSWESVKVYGLCGTRKMPGDPINRMHPPYHEGGGGWGGPQLHRGHPPPPIPFLTGWG